jgi:exonuclease III
METNCDILCI